MSESKACPFCGEQILAVAIKCKHCGSDLGDSGGASLKKQFKMRPAFKFLFALILLAIGAGVVFNWNQTGTLTGRGFTDEDVVNTERSIREEFGKRPGVTVDEVKLLRESPTKLTGFVKVTTPLIGQVEKMCTATLAEDSRFIWRCD